MNDEAKRVVATRDLTRVFGDGQEIRTLDGVTLTVEKCEFVNVMGPSRSGAGAFGQAISEREPWLQLSQERTI